MNSMMPIAAHITPRGSSQNFVAVALDACASGSPDDRRMHGSRGQHHAVSRLQFHDASYHARIDDSELVREAAAESRVLLTRDRDLTKRRVIQTGVVRAILIHDDDVTRQLRQVFAELGLELQEALTRCIECNSELES